MTNRMTFFFNVILFAIVIRLLYELTSLNVPQYHEMFWSGIFRGIKSAFGPYSDAIFLNNGGDIART